MLKEGVATGLQDESMKRESTAKSLTMPEVEWVISGEPPGRIIPASCVIGNA